MEWRNDVARRSVAGCQINIAVRVRGWSLSGLPYAIARDRKRIGRERSRQVLQRIRAVSQQPAAKRAAIAIGGESHVNCVIGEQQRGPLILKAADKSVRLDSSGPLELFLACTD